MYVSETKVKFKYQIDVMKFNNEYISLNIQRIRLINNLVGEGIRKGSIESINKAIKLKLFSS